jgi:hypothetical protein
MTAIHWIGGSADFTNATDWSGGVVPEAGDNAVIDAVGDNYTVTLSSAETVRSLILDDAGATLALSAGSNLDVVTNLFLKAGKLNLGPGAIISGGTLRAKGGKFIWRNGTLDGVTYDGPLNLRQGHSSLHIGPDGLVLTGSDGKGPGVINLRQGFIVFDGIQTITNTKINLNDSYIFGGNVGSAAVLTLGSTVLINSSNGGSIDGTEVINEGVINAFSDTKNHDTSVVSTTFANEGVIKISRQADFYLDSISFTNLVGGTLTGGDWKVDARSTLELRRNEIVVTDDAAITLSGAGSVFQSRNTVSEQEVPIEATLTAIGATGTLELLASRDWSSTNAITNAGTLVLGGGTFTSGALTNDGVVSGQGVIGVGIANSGTIEATAGALDLTQAITGSGELTVDATAILKVEAAASATLSTTFNGIGGVLGLGDAADFAATITGFAAGDTIDVLHQAATSATLQAGDVLAVMNGTQTIATLQLSGNYTGDTFAVASDGHGGANITVSAGLFAQAMSSMAGAPAGHAAHIPDASRLRSPMLAMPRAMMA